MLVCVDPGHGGRDPGAIGPTGLREADVAWEIAGHLQTHLLARGYRTMRTRGQGEYVRLADRAYAANEAGADLFISVHCNSFHSPDPHGTETLCHPASQRGQALATAVQHYLVARLELRDRGVKERPRLAVLRRTVMPAILVEVAFISNPEEEALLRDERTHKKAAVAIADGIDEYRRELADHD